MTFHGFQLWYADGTTRRGQTDADWLTAPSTGVQALAVFMDETYPIWLQDHYDESGRPVNQRRARERYRDFIQQAEYYYLSVALNLWGGATRSRDVPAEVPAGALKRGSLMTDAEWQPLVQRAYATRTWSGTEEAWAE